MHSTYAAHPLGDWPQTSGFCSYLTLIRTYGLRLRSPAKSSSHGKGPPNNPADGGGPCGATPPRPSPGLLDVIGVPEDVYLAQLFCGRRVSARCGQVHLLHGVAGNDRAGCGARALTLLFTGRGRTRPATGGTGRRPHRRPRRRPRHGRAGGVARRRLPDGRPLRRGLSPRRRDPRPRGAAPAVPPRRHRGHQRRLRRVRRGHRVRHRGRAVRSLRGVPLGLPRRPARRGRRRGRHALVAGGPRRLLAPPGRARLGRRRPAGPPGRPRLLERRPGVLRVGGRAPAHRGGMGVRRARRPGRAPLRLGRRTPPGREVDAQHLAGGVPDARHRGGRVLHHRAGPDVRAERVRPVADVGQRLGMVRGLVLRRLLPPLARRGPRRPGHRRAAGHARRVLPVPPLVLPPVPRGGALVQHTGVHLGGPRLPVRGRRPAADRPGRLVSAGGSAGGGGETGPEEPQDAEPEETEPEETEPDARFTFANERTFLAWNRTALAMVIGGVAIVQLLPPFSGLPWGRHLLAVSLIAF